MLAANAGLEERLSASFGASSRGAYVPRAAEVARLVGRPGELRGRWGDLSVDDRRSVVASVVERVVVSRMPAGASAGVASPAGDGVEIAYRPWLAGGERPKPPDQQLCQVGRSDQRVTFTLWSAMTYGYFHGL